MDRERGKREKRENGKKGKRTNGKENGAREYMEKRR